MRKFLSIILCIMLAASMFGCGTSRVMTPPTQIAQLYFIDSDMLRLIPSDFEVTAESPDAAARAVIAELIKGRDQNPKIRRLIPNIPDCMSVYVSEDIAYVNLTSDFIANHPDGKVLEFLTVYSIVNSLTSLQGIINVRFTIDGRREKDFKGFIDMRETFIPDYYV